MNYKLYLIIGIIVLCQLIFGSDLASRTIVVYNSNSPHSQRLAYYYAQKRNIPTNQIIGIKTPEHEFIDRFSYENQIEFPLIQELEHKNLLKRIPFKIRIPETSLTIDAAIITNCNFHIIVLCKGIPLKIEPDPTLKLPPQLISKYPEQLLRNEAAVDSELAALPLRAAGLSVIGPMKNPVYRAEEFDWRPERWKGVFIVSRLDGPDWEDVFGLIDRAIEGEVSGPCGRAYFDTRSVTDEGYMEGDLWLKEAYKIVKDWGFDAFIDDEPELWPQTRPMPYPFIYAGWYGSDLQGPFLNESFHFKAGAFAYHIHSFSASTVRSVSKGWVGPLVKKGVTCTVGYVYEPFLAGTLHLPSFLDRLINKGLSFGEAVYLALPSLSWQTTVVGDPLYRPFNEGAGLEKLFSDKPHAQPWAMIYKVNQELNKGKDPTLVVSWLLEVPLSRTNAILLEKIADLFASVGKYNESKENLMKALAQVEDHQHLLWLRCKLARQFAQLGEYNEALQQLELYLKEINLGSMIRWDKRLLNEAIQWARKVNATSLIDKYSRLME